MQLLRVMPALVAGIHVVVRRCASKRTLRILQ